MNLEEHGRAHGPLPGVRYFWACEEPERPYESGTLWHERCSRCLVHLVTHLRVTGQYDTFIIRWRPEGEAVYDEDVASVIFPRVVTHLRDQGEDVAEMWDAMNRGMGGVR